jgi:hypothetical protein
MEAPNLSQPKHDPQAYVELKEQGLSNVRIADVLDVSEAAVRRGLHKAEQAGLIEPQYLVPTYAQQRVAVSLEKPIRIDVAKDGPGAVTADWHLPLTDFPLVNTFIEHAREVKATNWLLIDGDFFNLDALSVFDFKQESGGLPAELYASTCTMSKLLETFDKVYFSWGNHDARVHRSLGYKVPFATAMRMMFHELDPKLMDRITLSNLDHQIVETPRGPYFVAHPKSYTSVPLSGARRLASVKLMNVITGHSHHTAIGHDPSGQFTVAEIGGFFDKEKTQYLQRSTNYPNWQNGYGFIDSEGYLTVEGQGWSSRMGRRAS